MSLVIRLLGPVEIEVDGRPLKVDTKKAIALLAYLASTGRPQPRDHLADLLWPDYDEERGRATLRRTLSALRSGLGEGWVEVDRARVALTSENVEIDVVRLKGAERSQEAEHVDELHDFAALFRGDFMQGFSLRDAPGFEEWQRTENEVARRAMAAVYDRLLDELFAAGNDDTAIDVAEKRIALDPLNEPTYRTLMRIHARKGERGAVVDRYRALVASLERELGVEPLEETTEIYRALSRGEGSTEHATHPELVEDPGDLPFVGRAGEWDELVTAYRRSGALILGIEGEPGIGKTRLVSEFLEHARALGARTVVARSHEGESNVAYGVLTDALRTLVTSKVAGKLSEAAVEELARLLPELDVPPADSPVASRFYESVRSAFEEGLRGERPGVMVFEDIHWCDDATLDTLAYVARRISETGIWLILTWRSEELPTGGASARLLRDVPSKRLALGRFARIDIERLVKEKDIGDVDTVVTRLLEETEGVPYFVGEYLKSIAGGGDWNVPSSVRELLVRRLGTARGAAAQVVDALAVIDRAVEVDVASRVSGRSDLETADALDELARSGLLRAEDDGRQVRYEFTHEKLRAVAYDEMGPARRHVLHRRTAEAIVAASSAADRDGPLASVIARHFELAGANEQAAGYHRRAGIWAHRMFAHNRALEHFQNALALGDTSAEVHEAIADVHVLQGDYPEAVNSYETAAALAASPEKIDHKLGALHLRRGDYAMAEAHLNDALTRSQDDAAIADILVDLSLTARRRGADDEAMRHAANAVERTTSVDDPLVRARAANAAGMLASSRGAVEEARDHLQIALDMATLAEDLPATIAALNNMALVERRERNFQEAIALTQQALEACRRFGDRHREAALENNLADLLHQVGSSDDAMDHLKRATAIFAEVGADPAGPLPEVWKLVEW